MVRTSDLCLPRLTNQHSRQTDRSNRTSFQSACYHTLCESHIFSARPRLAIVARPQRGAARRVQRDHVDGAEVAVRACGSPQYGARGLWSTLRRRLNDSRRFQLGPVDLSDMSATSSVDPTAFDAAAGDAAVAAAGGASND